MKDILAKMKSLRDTGEFNGDQQKLFAGLFAKGSGALKPTDPDGKPIGTSDKSYFEKIDALIKDEGIDPITGKPRLTVTDAAIQILLDEQYGSNAAAAEILKEFFVVPPTQIEAPAGGVRYEDIDYTLPKDDMWWRQYRDLESAENGFVPMLGMVQQFGERTVIFDKTFEKYQMIGNVAPHRGQGAAREKNRILLDKYLALHRTRTPHPMWYGLLGLRDVQDWERVSAKKYGVQWERFPNIPIIGRFFTPDGVPLNRSQATNRSGEAGWGAREMYDYTHEQVHDGFLSTKEEHQLRKKYKQISLLRAAAGSVFEPLFVVSGLLEAFKDLKKKLDRAYGGGGQ